MANAWTGPPDAVTGARGDLYCKDGSGPATGSAGSGIGFIGNGTGCFTGTRAQAASVGLVYDF